MNPDVLLDFSQAVNELSECVNKLKKNNRNSQFQYEDANEYNDRYEPKCQDLYNTCNPPHPCNTSFVVTTPDKFVSQHEPRCHSQSKPYSQVTSVVKKQDKQSPFDFSEIPGAPHPMPNDYTRRLPQFSGNNDISIESHLDILWDYMEIRGADNEDVYM